MKTLKCAILGLLACTACVSANVSEPGICDSHDATFPIPTEATQACSLGVSGNYQLPAQTTTFNFDFSDGLHHVKDVTNNLQVSVEQLSLSNTNHQLDFVASAGVSVQSNTLPSMPLATYTAPTMGVGAELTFQVLLSSDQVLNYLQSGPVVLTVTLNSSPITLDQACTLANQANLSTTLYMCVGASGKFSKSL